MIEKQFLSPTELIEYRKLITVTIFSTYKPISRSLNYMRLPERYNRHRCLYCGQLFLFVKDKRKYRYCSAECSYDFDFKFGLFAKERKLLEENINRCAICHKSIIYIWEDKIGAVTYIREKKVYDLDHIQELANFSDNKFMQAKMFLDLDNLQILCKSCHKKKTAIFLRERFSKKNTQSKKLEVLLIT